MFCGNCGQKIEDGAVFCGGCGSPVAQQPTTPSQEMPAWQQGDATQKFVEDRERLVQEETADNTPAKKRSKLYAIFILLGIAILAAVIVVAVWYFVLHKTPSFETPDDNMSQTEDVRGTEDADDTENDETVIQEDASQEAEAVIEETAPIVDKIEIDTINQIINSSGVSGTFSVTVLDLDSNRVYATSNGDSAYSASALINIPILFTIADGLKNNSLTLNDMAYFSYTFDGRGVLKKEQSGSRISVGQLMNDMLQYSDNNATNSLINHLGMNKINQTCNQNGFSSVRIERVLTTNTTTKDNYISTNDKVVF